MKIMVIESFVFSASLKCWTKRPINEIFVRVFDKLWYNGRVKRRKASLVNKKSKRRPPALLTSDRFKLVLPSSD